MSDEVEGLDDHWQTRIADKTFMTLSEIFAFDGTKNMTSEPPPEITVSEAEKHFSFSRAEKLRHLWTTALFDLHNSCITNSLGDIHTHSFAAKSVRAALLHCWHADPANHMDLIRVLRMAAFNLEIGGRECGWLKSREEEIRTEREKKNVVWK